MKNTEIVYLVYVNDVYALPVACFSTIKEVADFLDVPLRTAENTIYRHCTTKGFKVDTIIL